MNEGLECRAALRRSSGQRFPMLHVLLCVPSCLECLNSCLWLCSTQDAGTCQTEGGGGSATSCDSCESCCLFQGFDGSRHGLGGIMVVSGWLDSWFHKQECAVHFCFNKDIDGWADHMILPGDRKLKVLTPTMSTSASQTTMADS